MNYMRDVDGNRLDDIAVLDRLDDIDGLTDLPAYAGRRRNPYDPRLNVYNWKASNTRKLRAGLAKAMAGSARANLTFVGDSATDGKVTTTPATFDRLGAWPVVLRDVLALNPGIGSGGDGLVRAASVGGAADPRVSSAGGWNQTGFAYATVSANGATLTFTFTQPSTTVDVWYSLNSGPFTVSMDGASSGAGFATVTPPGGSTWAKATVTGAAGVHTVVVTTTSTTATSIANVNSYATSGLVIQNLGWSGTSIRDWITFTAWFQFAGMSELTQVPYTRDALFIGLGGNDIVIGGRTPTQMRPDMVTLLDRWDGVGDMVLVVPNQAAVSAVPNATWDEWAGILYDLADTYDIPLIDAYARFGSNQTAIANGLHGDTTHLNAAGYADQGRQAGTIVGA